jgi:PTS system fructose-specific IIB component/fructose-specific PTS system IIB-like component
MAAEALRKAANELGDEIKVEVQGAMGIENRLDDDEIMEAEIVVWAVDVNVRDKDRFEEKNVIQLGPNEVIRDAKKVLTEIKDNMRKP